MSDKEFATLGDSRVMECPTLVKLMNSKRKREYDVFMCDICKKYTTFTKWSVRVHKATPHNIPIPHDAKL